MTNALRRAFEVASQLPVLEQDELAEVILAELAATAQWDVLLDRDVAAVFSSSAAVNKALRALLDAVPARRPNRRRG